MSESTLWTGLGSVCGIDEYCGHSEESRFILDELPELIESPCIEATTLCLRNRSPATDTLEVLKSNTASGVFGFGHDLFGDAMVDVPTEPCGSSGESLEVPLGTLRPGTLKRCTQSAVFLSCAVDRVAGMNGSIRVHRKVDDTEIYTEEPIGVDRIALGNIKRQVEVEGSIPVDQICLASDSTDPCLLIGSENHLDNDSTTDSHEGDRFKPLERHDTMIVDHRTLGLEFRFDRLVPLVGLGNLRDCPDGQLCRESIFLPDGVVDMFLKSKLVRRAQLERGFRDLVTRGVELVHGFEKEFRLFVGRSKFDRQHKFHVLMLNTNGIKRCGIHPITKVMGFLPRGS